MNDSMILVPRGLLEKYLCNGSGEWVEAGQDLRDYLRASCAPYLFSLTTDLSACCLDVKGEPHHFTADEAFDACRKDADRYRWIEPVFAGLFGIDSMSVHIDAAMIKGVGDANEE